MLRQQDDEKLDLPKQLKHAYNCREQLDLLVQRQWANLQKTLMIFTRGQWAIEWTQPHCCSLWDQSTGRQWRSTWWRISTAPHDWYAPLTGHQHIISLTCSVQHAPPPPQGSHVSNAIVHLWLCDRSMISDLGLKQQRISASTIVWKLGMPRYSIKNIYTTFLTQSGWTWFIKLRLHVCPTS